MNTVVTSREAILDVSRELVKRQGQEAVSIRTVAAACGVSVGSIYNYFESKTDLVAATVESVWCDIFHFPEDKSIFESFIGCAEWIFDSMRSGSEKYPGFFASHSMGFSGDEKADGTQLMSRSWEHIRSRLSMVLMHDKNVRPGAFDDVFTQEKFVEIIFWLVIAALLQQNYDFAGIREMICRLIYTCE